MSQVPVDEVGSPTQLSYPVGSAFLWTPLPVGRLSSSLYPTPLRPSRRPDDSTAERSSESSPPLSSGKGGVGASGPGETRTGCHNDSNNNDNKRSDPESM